MDGCCKDLGVPVECSEACGCSASCKPGPRVSQTNMQPHKACLGSKRGIKCRNYSADINQTIWLHHSVVNNVQCHWDFVVTEPLSLQMFVCDYYSG